MKLQRRNQRRNQRSVLANLPAGQLQELIAWLVRDAMTYEKVQARLAAEFNVQISLQGISEFFRRYVLPEIDQREEWIRHTVRSQWASRLSTPSEPVQVGPDASKGSPQ